MNASIDRLIDLSLDEDLGASGDVTTAALIPAGAWGRAELWAKESMVLAGMEAFTRVFERVDGSVVVRPLRADGDAVGPREKVAELAARRWCLRHGVLVFLNQF